MLRDTKKWDRNQREIVLKFRRLHLKQQQIEREHLERIKTRSRQVDPRTGMPKEAVIFTDAMTSSRGNTPKAGVKFHSKPGKTILNRVFGTQIICGPVSFMMYSSVNQMVMGGANLAIEIQRLALDKLKVELQKRNLLMPRIMNFQFDNCGENKNKEMFCYASLLVELGYFDEFNVNFLVVGHTHCNLDQNFSVLSSKINDAPYVASPLAMRDLLGIAHKDRLERPLYNIEVEVVHDYKTFFEPFVNKSIKFYQVPHRFRISRRYGRAIFQYMLFTPDRESEMHWLPQEPHDVSHASVVEEQARSTRAELPLTPLMIVNGRQALNSELGLTLSLSESTVDDRINQMAFEQTHRDLLELELQALGAQIARMEAQRIGEEDAEPTASLIDKVIKSEVQKKMVATASQARGYILWLDFVRDSASDPETLLKRPPLLPKLDGIRVTDIDLDDLPDEGINQRAPVSAKLANHARTIAAVARKALYEVDPTRNILQLAPQHDTRPIHEITNLFTEKILSYKEYQWFKEHSTGEMILNSLRQLQAATREKDWVWLELPVPDQDQLDSYQLILVQNERSIIKQCQELLVRKRQGRSTTTEVLARQGLLDPDAVAASGDAAARTCIAAESGNITMDCGGIGPYHICTICEARCCSLHGPGHNKHEFFSTPQKVAAQKARLQEHAAAAGNPATNGTVTQLIHRTVSGHDAAGGRNGGRHQTGHRGGRGLGRGRGQIDHAKLTALSKWRRKQELCMD
jgi:hypothetical protein